VAVPDRVESAAVLLGLGPPEWFVAHVGAVAEVAAFLALQIARARGRHDRRLVEAAALLHDVDKLFDKDGRFTSLGHGDAGAAWLADRGYEELGPAVAAHPVRRLERDDARRWLETASLEERIVCYADKRAGQRLESVESRFAGWQRRYPQHASSLSRARPYVDRLEREVCAAAHVTPREVRRLPWVRDALAAARENSGARGARSSDDATGRPS
jgi:putative nucleotidyltransferase with HDIG domain